MKKRFFSKKKETGEINVPAPAHEAQINDSAADKEVQPDENTNDSGIDGTEAQDKISAEDSGVRADENTNDSGIPGAEAQDKSAVDSEAQGGDVVKINLLKKKKTWSLKKKIIVGSSCFIVAIIIGIVIFLSPFWMQIIHPSLSGFKTVKDQIPEQTSVNTSAQTQTETPTATRDAVSDLISQGNYDILKDDIVNILLIGVDYAPERTSWKGKHTYHSDVMIVLSINQTTNKVSLISLPRDTYAKIPGVNGIYKLNASLNCGGKWPETGQAACGKVCEAASWMIGGIPIDYYYAVDMTAVKNLVNKIGGVDFNVDIAFQMDGRSYQVGPQHMDGQEALDYMRVRHDEDIVGNDSSEEGDKARVNRQKNLLKAIFEKIKSSGGILQIPNILSAVTSDDFITNVSLDRTQALAGYALLNVNLDNINIYTIGGPYKTIFGLKYTITNQPNRVSILKSVYGIDITDKDQVAAAGLSVPNYSSYDWNSAHNLWLKMQKYVTKKQVDRLLSKIKSKLDDDAKSTATSTPTPIVTSSASASAASLKNGASYASVSFEAGRKYLSTGKEWTLYNSCVTERSQLDTDPSDSLIADIQSDITRLAGYLSIKVPDSTWDVIYNPWYGKFNQPYMHNEIKVDPR